MWWAWAKIIIVDNCRLPSSRLSWCFYPVSVSSVCMLTSLPFRTSFRSYGSSPLFKSKVVWSRISFETNSSYRWIISSGYWISLEIVMNQKKRVCSKFRSFESKLLTVLKSKLLTIKPTANDLDESQEWLQMNSNYLLLISSLGGPASIFRTSFRWTSLEF